MKITKTLLNETRTKKNSFTKKQIEVAKELTGASDRPVKSLVGMDVTESDWFRFVKAGTNSSEAKIKLCGAKRKKKTKVINKFTTSTDWAWKPQPQDTPEKKLSSTGGKKPKKPKESKAQRVAFYESREWRELRYRVLKNNDGCCNLCGRSKRQHGVILHVDHIKPRSKHPRLELVYENLQVLCEDCNLGKSNKDDTDWR